MKDTYKHLIRKAQHSSAGLPGDALQPKHVETRFLGHVGFPEAADSIAYEPVQSLLAVRSSVLSTCCRPLFSARVLPPPSPPPPLARPTAGVEYQLAGPYTSSGAFPSAGHGAPSPFFTPGLAARRWARRTGG